MQFTRFPESWTDSEGLAEELGATIGIYHASL